MKISYESKITKKMSKGYKNNYKYKWSKNPINQHLTPCGKEIQIKQNMHHIYT